MSTFGIGSYFQGYVVEKQFQFLGGGVSLICIGAEIVGSIPFEVPFPVYCRQRNVSIKLGRPRNSSGSGHLTCHPVPDLGKVKEGEDADVGLVACL